MVRHPGDAHETVGEKRDAPAPLVGYRDVGIADDPEATPVVAGEDRLDEAGDRVLPEVCGEVADAEHTVRVGIVAVRLDGERVAGAEGGVLGEDLLLGHPRLVEEGEEERASRLAVVRVQPERLAVVNDRLPVAPLRLERVGQVVLGLRVVGAKPQRLHCGGDRLPGMAEALE